MIADNQLATSHSRQSDQASDIALEVYADGKVAAVATFSRYLEDPRNPRKSSELFYEVTLHTIYVKEAFRQQGLAASLCG